MVQDMTTKKATRGAPAPRAYSSPRRQAQAQQTRRDVLRAAVRLFGDYGWSGTTLAAVAAEAGVAVETLYSTFGTKKALLREAFDVSLAGDNEPIALADRPEYTRLGEGTLADRIRAGARLQSETVGRSVRVWRAMRDAASGDAEIARWCADLEKARRDQHRDSLRRVVRLRHAASRTPSRSVLTAQRERILHMRGRRHAPQERNELIS